MRRNFLKWLFVAVFACASAASSLACTIVYGKDWAFASETPTLWASACHTQAMQGTAITLWPSNQRLNQADVVMYVTVSAKDFPSLSAFAEDEQSRLKASSPSSTIEQLKLHSLPMQFKGQLAAISHAPGNREEIVAYVEGPTAYFMVVITAASDVALASSRDAFLSFLASFVPMERK